MEAYTDALHFNSNISVENYRCTKEILQNHNNTTAAYSQNAVFILNKVRGTGQLLSDTLSLKHQKNAEVISENMLALNNMAAKDSATIRVITMVTLLFLPAQFVAVRGPASLILTINLIIIDSFRDAILLDKLTWYIDCVFLLDMDLLCCSHTVHAGYFWVLEMDGSQAETEGEPQRAGD